MIVTITKVNAGGRCNTSIHNGEIPLGETSLIVPSEMFISNNVRKFVMVLHDSDGSAIAGLAFDEFNDIVSMATIFDVNTIGLECIVNLINGVDWLAYVMMELDRANVLEVEHNVWGLIIDTSPYETIHVDGPTVRLRAPSVLN